MSVSSNDLSRVVRTIWSTQLGLDLQDRETREIETVLAPEETIVIQLRFTGDYSGTLEQRCSRRLSLRAAAAAFTADDRELDSGKLCDTVAELAHMTAGNLKSILPGNSEVSQAITIDAHQTGGEEPLAEAGFSLDGEPLLVTLRGRDLEA
jgi:hypothetical protein